MSLDAANIIEWVSRDVDRGVIVDDDILRFHVLFSDDPVATINAFPMLLTGVYDRVTNEIEDALHATVLGAGLNLMDQVRSLRRQIG